ncbi:transmembrane amino acid transporter protein-domain-containing protein [Zychaea mexicana]|uniref:transmembrane amino acid transporter protein-domain-containing protein n=1 Tax=Zychaea mexicana TaxID=64656 RepID=UPI0022FE6955|nr:transmembrane amino acid transporter protein-domain-containing protein [Zychaea mexicana]KAI9477110.1 transmembrane amino acid transporter protein-domain-containing protein [Zychaea mexicana]
MNITNLFTRNNQDQSQQDAGSFKIKDEKSQVVQHAIEDYIEEDDRNSEKVDFGHGTGSFATAYFNVVCVVAGTGTLGLPHAFAQGGWLGILILILAWAMAVYSGIILIQCLYCKPGERLHDYKQIGKAAYGWVGYAFASLFHILNLFGCPALYLVLASTNLHSLLEHTSGALTRPIWAVIVACALLIPMFSFKTLKEITIMAAVGAITTMIAVFVIVIESPIDHNANPQRTVIHDGVIWTGFPSALSTIAFSFGGNNTYPHVEHALKKPHQWKWAVTAGLSTCTALYFMTAVPGYWSFGRDAMSPIYDSLPSGEAAQIVAKIVMTIHVILAIPIYATSFALEFEHFCRIDEEKIGKLYAFLGRAAVRTVTMVILCILAIFIPYFDAFMSLIGALCNCSLVFLIPVLCHLKLFGIRRPIYELAFCALTLVLGIVGCVFGSKDAIEVLKGYFEEDA